jgi:ketol-acid reductoisomerase
MAHMYFEEDGDLSLLAGKAVSILGYGNQGEAWAQNLRDSGVAIVVGNILDPSFARATQSGFDAFPVAEAVRRADIHLLLMPDEIMPEVFASEIEPNLQPGHAIVVASGYNVTYGLLRYPETVDVLMIAPRMIGTGVRNGYVDGTGFPSLVCVHHAATAQAQETMLALCRAVGTLRMCAVDSSCDEETLCDLFNEHFGYVYALRRAYEILVEAGASPEAAMLEFWASGEEMELARVHFTHGLFRQLKLHSRTSQYGQEVTGRLTAEEEEAERNRLRRIVANIKDGTFARDWALEQLAGYPVWNRVRRENEAHPLMAEEYRLLETMQLLDPEVQREVEGGFDAAARDAPPEP